MREKESLTVYEEFVRQREHYLSLVQDKKRRVNADLLRIAEDVSQVVALSLTNELGQLKQLDSGQNTFMPLNTDALTGLNSILRTAIDELQRPA